MTQTKIDSHPITWPTWLSESVRYELIEFEQIAEFRTGDKQETKCAAIKLRKSLFHLAILLEDEAILFEDESSHESRIDKALGEVADAGDNLAKAIDFQEKP